MSTISYSTSSTTTTLTTINNEENTLETNEKIPEISELLSSFDTSEIRTEEQQLEVSNTIKLLIKRAQLNSINPIEYFKLILLISFKKRNHEKSLADGIGSGEKTLLRIIIKELYRYEPNLIKKVLQLIPYYGSWRDLQIIAELSYNDNEINELSNDIIKIFSIQLQKDKNIINTTDNCPSNACKYAPHEFRHHGSRKNRKAEKKSNGRKIQSHLGDSIASILFPDSTTHIRPLYRKLLSSLNERLTKKGFLIEPLMCKNQKSKIQFARAPKGSLNKYRKSIIKDSEAPFVSITG